MDRAKGGVLLLRETTTDMGMEPWGAGRSRSALSFEALVESATTGMLVLDAQRHILYANPALKELMGLGDEVLGRDILDYLDMANARKVEHEFDRRREGQQSEYEVDVQTTRGERRTLHVASVPELDADGRFCGTFAIITDITEKRSLQEKLQDYAQNLEAMVQARTEALIASEERYHEIFEKVTDGIVRIDPRGTILLCNHAFAAMLGSTVGDVMGRNIMPLLHHDDRPTVLEIERRRLAGDPGPPTRIIRVHRLDNHEIVYLETSLIVTYREGAIDAAQVIARDVTDRVRAEERLRRAYAELKGLSQAKSNFLSNVTHELKTPLVTIRGYTQMLQNENLGAVNPQQQRALQTSLRNIDVLLAHIERLLSISRLELDDGGLAPEPVPVRAFCEGCCADAFPLADSKGIHLVLKAIPERLPALHADWAKLNDAIGHLVVNGIKFTDPGGTVEVSAAAGPEGYVRILVRDTGIGIEAERIEKLFEPFEQGDGTYTRDYEGLGLGLALVRRVIEAHGGRIGAESEYGRGSTFWCDIPASPEAPRPTILRPERQPLAMWDVNADHASAADAEPEADTDFDLAAFDLDEGYAGPVMFVDHDTDMLRFVEQAFQAADIEVNTQASPEDLLENASTLNARLIFLDVGFPDRDGVDLCRQLKTDPRTAAIPVYMFTGHNGSEVRARAQAAGADGFIAKPVSLDYLLEVVARHKSSEG